MAEETRPTERSQREQLDQLAEEKRAGLLREYWSYLMASKKWYMIPVVLALMALGVLIVAGGSAVAPFIYTLF